MEKRSVVLKRIGNYEKEVEIAVAYNLKDLAAPLQKQMTESYPKIDTKEDF